MKAGLFLALWEVATHVSIGGCLHILAGPTSGEQIESGFRAAEPRKKNLFFHQMRFSTSICKEL